MDSIPEPDALPSDDVSIEVAPELPVVVEGSETVDLVIGVAAAEDPSAIRVGKSAATRPPVLDSACAKAVDLAHTALVAVVPEGHVGDHLTVFAEHERVATHLFGCLAPGYVGWTWSVTVSRASRARTVTVGDIVLVPGEGALVAPPWVPWSQRVEPGDLGVGDVLPSGAEDPRLLPGYADLESDDSDHVLEVAWEIGLGRQRVLSSLGREEAAARWRDGDTGPSTPMAKAAPGPCSTCGFMLTLAGNLGQAFGVCANRFAPTDGRIVALDYGCGAHSEALPHSDEPDESDVDIQAAFVVNEETGDIIRTGGSEPEPGI